MEKSSNGWWTRAVQLFETVYRAIYEVGGTLGDEKITEIAMRGSHHHGPDFYDVYCGDECRTTIAARHVGNVQYIDWPIPPHQTFIPAPHTRSTAPPAGEHWCPFIRQACWGEGCHRKPICDAELAAVTKPKRTRTRKAAPAEAAND